MARIRSVHPGQWTDDDFVSCSPFARLLALAIRNHADDNGVFEWAPVKLKMLCLPGDSCDILPLLEELIVNKQVRRFEAGGKAYGLIRKFKQWQRPKKPSVLYPFPTGSEFAAYVRGSSSELAGDETGSGVESVDDESGVGGELDATQNGVSGELPWFEGGSSREPVRNRYGNSSADVGGRRKEVGGKKKRTRAPEVPLPPDFGISDVVRAWAREKGFDRLEEHLESFKNKALAKDYRYANWDAAFRNAIADDWARLRVNASVPRVTPPLRPAASDVSLDIGSLK